MNRNDFQKLAWVRLEEAKALLDGGKFDGAYYLAGYCVECALKACIAKRTQPEEFPPGQRVVRRYYSHDLADLVNAAELDEERLRRSQVGTAFESNWSIVRQWKEVSRYDLHGEATAKELIDAIEHQVDGVFPWLRSFW